MRKKARERIAGFTLVEALLATALMGTSWPRWTGPPLKIG
jgi:hypothetical protein